jgi:hypothetical protein
MGKKCIGYFYIIKIPEIKHFQERQVASTLALKNRNSGSHPLEMFPARNRAPAGTRR